MVLSFPSNKAMPSFARSAGVKENTEGGGGGGMTLTPHYDADKGEGA